MRLSSGKAVLLAQLVWLGGCVAPGGDGGPSRDPRCSEGEPGCEESGCAVGDPACEQEGGTGGGRESAAGGTAGTDSGGNANGTGSVGSVGGSGSRGSTGEESSLEDVREACESTQVGPRLLRRLTRRELEASLRDIFPELADAWAGVRLSPDPVSDLGFTTDASVLVVSGPLGKELLRTAEDVASLLTEDAMLARVLPCASDENQACATQFIEDYGTRLFRRPLTPSEVKDYVDYFDSVSARSDFGTGLKWVLVTLIQSPRTVYRSEIGTDAGDGVELTQYEIATNLAYTYSGTVPDEALLSKARGGELSDPGVRRAEAERLLTQGTQGQEALHAFFLEWLEYRQIIGQSRQKVPEFSEEISPLLAEETRAFLQQVVFEENGNVERLMTADYTMLNRRLADFYGFGDPDGDAFERVTRPAERGLGILAQGSLLAGRSHQEHTSPTLRGLQYFQDFLCNTKPKPPANIPSLEETTAGVAASTTREKYELTHSIGECGACHRPFEPYGYSMEQYDELGRYRADEEGHPIDTVATALLSKGRTQEFTSIEDLSTFVKEGDEIENCVSGLMTAYLLSGGGGAACLAAEARTALAAGELSLVEFALALSEVPHFAQRTK